MDYFKALFLVVFFPFLLSPLLPLRGKQIKNADVFVVWGVVLHTLILLSARIYTYRIPDFLITVNQVKEAIT